MRSRGVRFGRRDAELTNDCFVYAAAQAALDADQATLFYIKLLSLIINPFVKPARAQCFALCRSFTRTLTELSNICGALGVIHGRTLHDLERQIVGGCLACSNITGTMRAGSVKGIGRARAVQADLLRLIKEQPPTRG